MSEINFRKWIPFIVTLSLYVQIFVHYVRQDMWITKYAEMEFILVTIFTVFIAFITMFIRPVRRFYYPFAPLFWGVGIVIAFFAIFDASVIWMYIGFLFLLPAQIFMYFIFKSSNSRSK